MNESVWHVDGGRVMHIEHTASTEGLRLMRKIPRVLLLAVIAVLFLVPFEWMFASAFKTTQEISAYAWPVSWKTFLPPHPTLENFRNLFMARGFGRNMLNSLLVATCQMMGTLIVCSLSAFALSRLRFTGRSVLFALILLIAMVPFEVMIVPLYVLVRSMGLMNNYITLFIPWVANPFGIFLLRQAFMEIPREYDEAAILEGASPFQVYRHVILPNATPALVTLAVMSFLWSWNDFMWPLIVMQHREKQVVQVAIATFQSTFGHQPIWGEIFAGAAIATVPVLVIFVTLQRHYVRGVVMTGLKG